jgi:flagellar biosynthesis chaperone FliJ
MAFRFTLDAVLRFRESVEHSEEVALLRIVQQIFETERELGQAETEQIRIREGREQDLAIKLPGVHLTDIALRELELKTLADGLRSQLRQLELERVNQLVVYQTARQDRQVLTELREQQRHRHPLEQKRQEQKTLDDLFLARTKERN